MIEVILATRGEKTERWNGRDHTARIAYRSRRVECAHKQAGRREVVPLDDHLETSLVETRSKADASRERETRSGGDR